MKPLEGEPEYWASTGANSPDFVPQPLPELPQVPDVAFEMKCLTCRHTLDKHTIDAAEMTLKENSEGKMSWFGGERWTCATLFSDPEHRAVTQCSCTRFKPSPSQVAGFREEPPL